MDNGKVFGLRVPPRGVKVLLREIKKSGLSQSEFFRVAIEAQMSAGGLPAVAFERGRVAGRKEVAFLLRKYAENIESTATKYLGPEYTDDEWSDRGP